MPNKNKPLTQSSSVSSCLERAHFLLTPPYLHCFLPLASDFSVWPRTSALCIPRTWWPARSFRFNVGTLWTWLTSTPDSPMRSPRLLLSLASAGFLNSQGDLGKILAMLWVWLLGSPWSVKLPCYLLSQNDYLAWNSVLDSKFCSFDNVPSSLLVSL